jgi:hypothetical protein
MDINNVQENSKSFQVPFIKVDKEVISNFLYIAFSKAILHWCQRVDLNTNSSFGLTSIDVEQEGWSATIHTDNGETFELNDDSLKTGLVAMATQYPNDFISLICGSYEDDIADTLVQCCIFEEVLF